MLKPIITLKDIAVSFDGEQVLKNFNLTIGDGEFVTPVSYTHLTLPTIA